MATLTDVLTEIERNGRVCPQPQKWNELYRLVPANPSAGTQSRLALPLILAAWWHTTPDEKRQRLREHVEWAAANHSIDRIHGFLVSLTEDDWVHTSDAPAGRHSFDSQQD